MNKTQPLCSGTRCLDGILLRLSLVGKGLYHINAVDEVTQWEIVQAVSRISEAYLLPVLESMLHQFPFAIVNFHSTTAPAPPCGADACPCRARSCQTAKLVDKWKLRLVELDRAEVAAKQAQLWSKEHT